jgi:hypothetical protein
MLDANDPKQLSATKFGGAIMRAEQQLRLDGDGSFRKNAGVFCDNCAQQFDPVASHWLCPHCHYKATCCEGEPQ